MLELSVLSAGSVASGIAEALFKVLVRGGTRTRIAIVAACVGLLSAPLLAIAGDAGFFPRQMGYFLAALTGLPSAAVLFGFSLVGREQTATEVRGAITAAVERVREHPDQPAAAWELGSLRLQSYIDRNLGQVGWIFVLILIVMAGGFAIVGIGVWEALRDPAHIAPSLVAAGSGIIVQFIGATFLVVYRSTNDQARAYVGILERINAVGMSMRILETIDASHAELRDQARIEVARGLLTLYGEAARTESKVKRRRAR